MEKLKNQIPDIQMKLEPDCSFWHLDSNDVNDTQIRARMQKLEQVKVQV